MISHSNCNFLMDWEPAESYSMDVDVTQDFFSFADCDVYMAPPSIQEVHMASPILTSQPPAISGITFFLPPLEMKTKPIVFPPFNIHAISRQALEPLVGPRKTKVAPLDVPFVYMPAIATYQVEPPTMPSASCQGDNYTFGVHNHNHSLPTSVYPPVTPSPSKSRTIFPDVSPIKPIDILDEEGQIADSLAATPSPLIECSSSAGWPDRIAGPDIAPNVDYIPWPDSIDELDVTPSTPHLVVETNTPEWIDEQDVTPCTPHLVVAKINTPERIGKLGVTLSTPQLVVAETHTPEWSVDEDVTPLSQYPILEAATPFHWPEVPFFQEYIDWGVDLIDLWSPNFESSNLDEDDSVLRAFGVSRLEDLDWILEGFRAASVADVCVKSKCASNSFEATFVPAPLHNLSPVSLYDWTASGVGPDLISFDSAYGLHHNIHSGSFKFPSLESGDVIQFESNLFQTSTPAPYKRSALPDVQSRSPLIFNKPTYTVEGNAPRNTKIDASTQTEELPGVTNGLRSPRRYSPYMRHSPHRKLSPDFTFGSSGSGDLEGAQATITACTSCGLPFPMDNVFPDCSIQTSIISECELDARPAIRMNLMELEEDDQEKGEDDKEKEKTFPGAYPIEQAVYALDEPAKSPARHFVKVAQKNHFETDILPCRTVHPSTQYGFKELFFSFFVYFFDW